MNFLNDLDVSIHCTFFDGDLLFLLIGAAIILCDHFSHLYSFCSLFTTRINSFLGYCNYFEDLNTHFIILNFPICTDYIFRFIYQEYFRLNSTNRHLTNQFNGSY